MEEDQRRRPPRAVNIIRPSSPLLHAFRRPYFLAQEPSATPSITTAGSMTSSSTWSSSSSSVLSADQQTSAAKLNGLIHNRPGSPFVRSHSPTGWSVLSKNMPYRAMSPLGNHHHTPLSRIAALSSMSTDSTDDSDDDDDDDDDDLDDSDDDISPDASSSEEDEPEVVARMKKGCTIMNGKGKFITIKEEPLPKDPNGNTKLSRKVKKKSHALTWMSTDNCIKIADLEIEVKSLSTVNASLEDKTRLQAARIAELEKMLER